MKISARKRSLWPAWPLRLVALCFVLSVVVLALSAKGLWRKPYLSWTPRAPLQNACIPPTPVERAALWDYIHNTNALNRVSDSAVAQTLFNQGLLWRFGFAENASRTAFDAALEVDPDCAMCFWGEAYSYAPNINTVALPDDYPFPHGVAYPHFSTAKNRAARIALAAAENGPQRSVRATQYIQAMWLRYPDVEQVDMHQHFWCEFLFGAKMMAMWREDLTDLIAGALAAEAFMNTMPWRFSSIDGSSFPTITPDITWRHIMGVNFPDASLEQFSHETGLSVDDKILAGLILTSQSEARKIHDPHFKEISQVVEHMLLWIQQSDPDMPLANHLHIHLTEASAGANPQVGIRDADMLMDTSYRWKAGHLAHMPSHSYYRVGEFFGGVLANVRAHELDLEVDQMCMPPYVPEHNLRVLVACAALGALLEPAEEYATHMRRLRDVLEFDQWMDAGHDYVTLLLVWGQFGQWDRILAEPEPTEGARGLSAFQGLIYSRAVYHFLRFMAFTHQPGFDPDRAEQEYSAFSDVALQILKVPTLLPGYGPGNYGAGYNELAHVAMHYMNARTAMLSHDYETAIGEMQEAVEIVDGLFYMEPPWAQQPPRQCLAYLYLVSNQIELAQEVYLRDLYENPKNPWSLFGCQQAQCPENAISHNNRQQRQSSGYKLTSSCPMLEIELDQISVQ